jgi:hypothetical protein
MRLAVIAAAAAALLAGGAQAQTAVGLTADGRLVTLDLATGAAGTTVPVSGAGGRLVGIDVRPADGRLYGLTDALGLVVLDAATGTATPLRTLAEPLDTSGPVIVDFNPAADRLRLIDRTGRSLRVDVDAGTAVVDGSLAYAAGDAGAGVAPAVVAGAYTNSVAGVRGTELFDLDAARDALLLQSPPNDGALQTRGPLGIDLPVAAAFDILLDADEENLAFLAAGGVLYRVDLDVGTATRTAALSGDASALIDLAVLPVPR